MTEGDVRQWDSQALGGRKSPQTGSGTPTSSDPSTVALPPPPGASSLLHPKVAQALQTGNIDFTIPEGIVTPAWKDNAAQRVGVAYCLLQGRGYVADPTGCGKTPMALIAYGIVRRQLGLKALVVTTQSNLEPWVEKAEKFLYHPNASVYWGEDRQDALDRNHDLLVTTFDTAVLDRDILRAYFKGGPPVLIVDEAHYIRSWGLPTTRKDAEGNRIRKEAWRRPGMEELAQGSRYVWALTATMSSGRLGDIASLIEYLQPGYFGGASGFNDDYVKRVLIKLRTGRRFYKKPTRLRDYKNVEVFLERAKPFILRRPVEAFEEVLPPVEPREVWVDMDPDHQRLYKTILDGILPETEDRDLRILADIAASTYAMVASDSPWVLGYKTKRPPAKARALLELLDGDLSTEKVVIYSRYAKVAKWLAALLQKKDINVFGTITGDDSQAARTETRRRLEQDPAESGAVLITDAGSEALDLQAARVVILYNLPFTADRLAQIVGRIRRIGTVHQSLLVYVMGHRGATDLTRVTQLKLKTQITQLTNLHFTSTPNTIDALPTTLRTTKAIRETSTATTATSASVFEAVLPFSPPSRGRGSVRTKNTPTLFDPLPAGPEGIGEAAPGVKELTP